MWATGQVLTGYKIKKIMYIHMTAMFVDTYSLICPLGAEQE